MKKLMIMAALLVAVTGVFAQTKTDGKGSNSAAVVYTCPMHPDIVSTKPGKCPKCGMTLVEKQPGGTAPAGNKKGTSPNASRPIPGIGKKDSASMKGMKM